MCYKNPMARSLERARELGVAGHYREMLALLEADPRPEEAFWLRLHGWGRWHLGDREGLEEVRRAALLAEEQGTEPGWAWQDVGAILFRAGRWEKAAQALERALAHFREAKDREGEAWSLHGLGVTMLHWGRTGEALEHAETAWALVRQKHVRHFEGRVLVLLSDTHRARGEATEALFRAEQALARKLDADDLPVALRALAASRRAAGRYEEALLALRRAEGLGGDGVRQAAILAEKAPVLVALGREEEAERAVGKARPLLEEHAPARARALVALAEISRRRGNEDAAVGLVREALEAGPYPLMEESGAFPELFALAARGGVSVPRIQRREALDEVRLAPWGRKRLLVGEREVPLAGSGRAFELMVFLALEGPTAWERVAEALWEPPPGEPKAKVRRRLRMTVSRARDLLADPEAVLMRNGVLELNPRREWRVLEGKGRFLEGLWTEWAEGRRSNFRL